MATSNRLTLAEELLLVALDDESGKLLQTQPFALDLAIAAALVAELSMAGRIDSDPERLFVVSREPTSDALLDEALATIASAPQELSTAKWLLRLADPAADLRSRIIARLVERGVLRSVEKRLLWVFKTRVFPPASGIEEREVKSRLMTLFYNDEIPDARDTLLTGLLKTCGILDQLLSKLEAERLRPRIDQIINLEEINRSLSDAVSEMQLVMASTMASFPH